jgi:hypothetical protein
LCADPIGTAAIELSQLYSPFDCAAIDGGASCADSLPSGDGGPGAVRCELDGSKCSPEEADSCQGTVINLCVRGTHTPFECAKIGKGCVGSTPHCEL